MGVDFIEKIGYIRTCQWIQLKVREVGVRIVPDDGFPEDDKMVVESVTALRCGEVNMNVIYL